ncbi:neutral zinc metallopeptidase [Corynebacterium hansenii]|uniref:Neutral zinc metallopeptidase n=1 Tax=Corynebacterium hansenii TaxID=394964 RepID=A0ABV7ZQD4_9CORY|nr:neutral zinc metallopeptidase [Corynebacterium hansenii]WJY99915.1 Putative neutral zinc metallopeptidase [Corynebacterium hansenii]
MTFRSDFQKSGDRARRGGGGRGGGIAVGGGLTGLLVVGLILLLGGDPSEVLQSPPPQQGGDQQNAQGGFDHCQTGDDGNKYVDCRIMFTGESVDRVWAEQLPAQAGIQYTKPGMVIFEGSTNSGCGPASASTGPFYCPADETSYFDTSFFGQLERMGGGDGPLAQQYVVAHEFGHHIQKLENTLGRSNYNEPGPESDAVKIELQADCYAGFWAHYADKGPDAILEPLTQKQVADAVRTARAIGDDTIQSHSGGGIRPDLWTHGSSEQRADAFLTGYNSGKLAQCDTLGRGVYR